MKKRGDGDLVKMMRTQTNDLLKSQKADRKRRIQEYKDNKADRDEAAFKVLDMDKDEKIVLSEFLDVFDPASKKHNEVLVVLGFMTERERAKADEIAAMEEVRISSKRSTSKSSP